MPNQLAHFRDAAASVAAAPSRHHDVSNPTDGASHRAISHLYDVNEGPQRPLRVLTGEDAPRRDDAPTAGDRGPAGARKAAAHE